jgi:hypothetical protein
MEASTDKSGGRRRRELTMRRILIVSSLLVVLVLAGGFVLAPRGHAQSGDSEAHKIDRRVSIGFKIAPVPLDLEGKNRDLVGLGSYLVNATGGCNDCHTTPSYTATGNPFNGQPTQVNAAVYLAGGAAFGPFYSRDITPYKNGLPAGRTWNEFLEVVRTGKDFDYVAGQPGPPLLQVMPWPDYRYMTDHELRAIYEYLRAIPPLQPNCPSGTTVASNGECVPN